MFSSTGTSVFLVLAFIASAIIAFPAILPPISVSITSTDVDKVKGLPQGVELIPLNQDLSTEGIIRYTLVIKNIYISDDKQLRMSSSSVGPSESPFNIQMRLEYQSETTYVQVDIKQNSTDSQAYAVSNGKRGGIDVIVVANNTYYFNQTTTIYGINK
ncbi:uncharacterized protein LOC129907678 [Episyrphus balteatus]|uniref:uncharacterized protein LOC129907678 n=1 Tax=Episyrphus balteatus TaxID=286459 RepID=UPI00248689EA|nr:uncharacterized protein LOC129907678 [Episyrphus balteatus]